MQKQSAHFSFGNETEIEDLGNGFAIGCAGGSIFYFFKGK